MRTHNLHSLPLRRLLPVWVAALAVATLATASAAPSKKASRGKKPPAPALPPPEMDRNSSRFILPENQPAYLEKMRGRMSMSKRVADPFGRSQDPDAAPVIVVQADPGGNIPKTPRGQVPLQQALSNFKITTIIPGENRFLANSRSYQKGESIAFKSRGKVINVHVMSVSSSEITFRNDETGEVANIKMKMLPPGMQPGTTLSEAPGIFRSQKDVPINLDAPGQP